MNQLQAIDTKNTFLITTYVEEVRLQEVNKDHRVLAVSPDRIVHNH